MDGSPSSIVMLGLGNGTFDGSPGLIVTLGFGQGEEVIIATQYLHYTAPLRLMDYTAQQRILDYTAVER